MIRTCSIALFLSLILTGSLFAAEKALTTDQQKLSYVVGSQVGASLKRQGIEPDFDALLQAIKDVYSNKASRFTKEEQQAILQKFQAELTQKQALAALGTNAWKVKLTKPEMMTFEKDKTYYWILQTNKGTIKIKLMPDVAPMHVTSTIFLTEKTFYDGLTFHRVIPGFMAQGGDPLGNGTGGPGYKYDGEFSNAVSHDQPYIVSMANSGEGTDGSQFFITFTAQKQLDGKHTIFGVVVDGIDVVKKLEAAGSASGETRQTLTIIRATIEKKTE